MTRQGGSIPPSPKKQKKWKKKMWEISEENKKRIEEAKEMTEQKPVEIEFKSLLEAEKKRGLKIGIYGDFATGKTHFALTAPEPIFIIDTELGSSPLAHLFKGKDIKILDVAEKDGSRSFEKIEKAVEFISKQDKIGTVVIDSVSDFWDYTQEFAKVNIFKIKPQDRLAQQWDWGIINKLYLSLLLKLIKLDCNLILTARETEIYAGPGQPTNMVKPKWQKNTGFWVDFVLYASKKIDKFGKVTFYMNIEKSRQIGTLMGKNYQNLNFTKLKEEIEKLKK